VGTSCLSVAVLRGHKPIAAISMTGPTERLCGQHEQSLVRALHDCLTPHLPVGLLLQMPTARNGRGEPALQTARNRAEYALGR